MELIEIELPLVHPFRTSFGSETHKQAIIVKLTDTEGNVGWGETAVSTNPGYCYETVKTAWHIQNDFLYPIIKKFQEDSDEFNIEKLIKIWGTVRGHDFAKPLFINSRSKNPEDSRLSARSIQLMVSKYSKMTATMP